MSTVSFLGFESVNGKRIHEGIFISKNPNILQASVTYSSSGSHSLVPGSRSRNVVFVHDALSSYISFDQQPCQYSTSSSTETYSGSIDGIFIEMGIRKDRTSSCLKVQQFFKLNDSSSQQIISMRQVGKIASIQIFLDFLKSVPLPGSENVMNSPYSDISQGGVLPNQSYSTSNSVMLDKDKSDNEIAREWYVLAIQQAEIYKILKRRF